MRRLKDSPTRAQVVQGEATSRADANIGTVSVSARDRHELRLKIEQNFFNLFVMRNSVAITTHFVAMNPLPHGDAKRQYPTSVPD